MRRALVACASLIVVAAAVPVNAAERLVMAPPAQAAPAWSWTGGYFGGHVGGMAGSTSFSDPYGASIYGDDVSQPAFLAGIQLGFNWQAPGTRWVLGIEGDGSLLDSVGTNTCLAYSGFFLSANCRDRPTATTTLTGRIGFAAGAQQRTLYYVKGGLAGIYDRIDIATNPFTAVAQTSANTWEWGWTVGAGIERALTPAWSLRFEYDYLNLAGTSVATPASYRQPFPPLALFLLTSAATSDVTHQLHQFKIALSYHFGENPLARWPDGVDTSGHAATLSVGGWEITAGGRYWYSWGRFAKDLASSTDSAYANVLNSRLTYSTTANSGEVFGRIETPVNVFVKGFVGGGTIASGDLYDEDWFIPTGFITAVPYSNTRSGPVSGSISYATIDLGFDAIRTARYRLGAFVGYNYYAENKDAYGCVQNANRFSDCVPSISSSVLGISENDTWKSLRVGLNGELTLLPGLKLSADVAYLPYVKFDGVDIHHLRSDVPDQTSPETGSGQGVQLETILSYDVTPLLSIGVGGRYWAMWTNDTAYTNIFGTPCPCQLLPSKTERYGVFLQAAYRFSPTTLAANRAFIQPTNR
jgi:opacity protein-like surface antigen